MNLATVGVILFAAAFIGLSYWMAITTEVVPREKQRPTMVNSTFVRANEVQSKVVFILMLGLAALCLIFGGFTALAFEAFLVIMLLAEGISALLTFLTGAFTRSFYVLAFLATLWRAAALGALYAFPLETGLIVAASLMLIQRGVAVFMNKVPEELVEEASRKNEAKAKVSKKSA